MSTVGGKAPDGGAGVRLNWRLYRLYLLPVAAMLLVAAFALGNRPAPMSSTLAPEAFEGSHAYTLLSRMQQIAPSRQPGGRGDARLLRYLERWLASTGGTSRGGYSISRLRLQGATSLGSRALTILLGQRPGSGSQEPILLIAHRDAVGPASEAQLSGTAALLQIALVLANTETVHPVDVIFSDGGSTGGAGIAAFVASRLHTPVDAAIVLGDVAGSTLRRPLVQPFSAGMGAAPEVLQRTVSAALAAQLGTEPGSPGLGAQLAHLAFPIGASEQEILNEAGIPAVAVDLAGEAGPRPGERVSAARLQQAGRAVLSAFYALDNGSQVPRAQYSGLTIASRKISGWALRLLIGTLLLAPLAVSIDALVRSRRRGERVSRWIWLALAGAAPPLVCWALIRLLDVAGIVSAPSGPVAGYALSFTAGAIITLLLAAAALLAGWRAWAGALAAQTRRIAAAPSPVLASLLIACLLGVLVWLLDPYAALLIVPSLHAWLLLASPRHRPRGRLGRLAIALAPAGLTLGLLMLYYASALGLGPGGVLLDGLMIAAGGGVGFGGALLWSVALGLLIGVALTSARGGHPLAPRTRRAVAGPGAQRAGSARVSVGARR